MNTVHPLKLALLLISSALFIQLFKFLSLQTITVSSIILSVIQALMINDLFFIYFISESIGHLVFKQEHLEELLVFFTCEIVNVLTVALLLLLLGDDSQMWRFLLVISSWSICLLVTWTDQFGTLVPVLFIESCPAIIDCCLLFQLLHFLYGCLFIQFLLSFRTN